MDAAAGGGGADGPQDGPQNVDKSPMAWDFSRAPWNQSKRPRIEQVPADGTPTKVVPANPPDLKVDDKSGSSSVKVRIFGP